VLGLCYRVLGCSLLALFPLVSPLGQGILEARRHSHRRPHNQGLGSAREWGWPLGRASSCLSQRRWLRHPSVLDVARCLRLERHSGGTSKWCRSDSWCPHLRAPCRPCSPLDRSWLCLPNKPRIEPKQQRNRAHVPSTWLRVTSTLGARQELRASWSAPIVMVCSPCAQFQPGARPEHDGSDSRLAIRDFEKCGRAFRFQAQIAVNSTPVGVFNS
jgi:hypothetical protein